MSKKIGKVSFKNMAAQGDIVIFKVDGLPKDATPAKKEKGKFIVAHSETGHHHTVTAQKNQAEFFLSSNPMVSFLKVNEPVELRHERDFDTHKTIVFAKGIYQINRQREKSPEGWRTVMD